MEPMQKETRKNLLTEFSKKIDVNFADLTLLDMALTHKSHANETQSSVHNERLEFLGDAVLELATSAYLYQNFPDLPEGELTKLRASIVCSSSLAKLAKNIGLGDLLKLGHGEEMDGGRIRQTNLEDAFEAVIGAIYLDQGWETARSYCHRQLQEEFIAARKGKTFKDFKTLFQELVQKKPGHLIEYRLLKEEGPDHAKSFTFALAVDNKVYGIGQGRSKKEAEQEAARAALDKYPSSR